MALGGVGLTDQKLSLSKPILGYSDTSTVKLDFDDTEFKTVKYWALRTMQWFKLRGFIILKASENHFHVVFDRPVTWKKNVHIMAWVCIESKNKGLIKWFLMQCIKGSSTLRISSKKDKPSTWVVFRYGKQDKEIRNFLKYRKLVKKS
jgi:hypothetical protein